MQAAAYTADQVEQRLYAAGRALMALRVSGCWPAGYRSSMPEMIRMVDESYGRVEADFRVAPPTSRQIFAMDQALSWIRLLPIGTDAELRVRKLVMARCLCSPRNERPVFTWRVLGKQLGVSHVHAKTLFLRAVDAITARLNQPGFCMASGGRVGMSGLEKWQLARVPALPRRPVREIA